MIVECILETSSLLGQDSIVLVDLGSSPGHRADVVQMPPGLVNKEYIRKGDSVKENSRSHNGNGDMTNCS